MLFILFVRLSYWVLIFIHDNTLFEEGKHAVYGITDSMEKCTLHTY